MPTAIRYASSYASGRAAAAPIRYQTDTARVVANLAGWSVAFFGFMGWPTYWATYREMVRGGP